MRWREPEFPGADLDFSKACGAICGLAQLPRVAPPSPRLRGEGRGEGQRCLLPFMGRAPALRPVRAIWKILRWTGFGRAGPACPLIFAQNCLGFAWNFS